MDKSNKKWDVFISHASEDKNPFVKELANRLKYLGIKVWYDEFTLKIGDSLSRKIDEGLIESEFGIIIISKNFIKKNWTEYELKSFLTKEIGFKKVILPIWLNITYEEVKKYSLYLADKFALQSEGQITRELILNLTQVIKPSVFESYSRFLLYTRIVDESETKESKDGSVNLNELKLSEIRHPEFPKRIKNRIKTTFYGFANLLSESLEDYSINFRRDLNPLRELQIWEKMNTTFLEFNQVYFSKEKEFNLEVAKFILQLSFGSISRESNLTKDQILKLVELYKANFHEYEYEE